MTPARSLAASVAALGFASTITAPLPAFAAPAPCERAENYAAQSGAELLRIERLEVRTAGTGRSGRSARDTQDGEAAGATDRILGADAVPLDPTDESGEDSDTLSEGIGMLGEAVLDSTLPGGAGSLTDPDRRARVLGTLSEAGGQGATGLGADSTGLGAGATGSNAKAVGFRAPEVGEDGDGAGADDDGPGADGADGAGADADDAIGDGLDADRGGAGADDGDSSGQQGGDGASSWTRGRGAAGRTGDETRPDESPDGRDGTSGGVVREVGLGEARTALVGTARIKSAGIARILDADGRSDWTRPILQQAPPTNAQAATRQTPAGRVGPMRFGAGEVSAHARWDAGMACGHTVGETSRSAATMRGASILGTGEGALVHVPGKLGSRTTTALERNGRTARTVAAATVTAGRIELAGGKVRVRVLRPPSLVASMTVDGGEVRYRPARIEVSGPGVATRRLDAVGDHVDVTVRAGRQPTEAGALRLGKVRPGAPLPLPAIPGLPQVQAPPVGAAPSTKPAPAIESAPGGATTLRISLGGFRQATKDNAIAARASAVKVTVTPAGQAGYHGKPSSAVSLDLTLGLMEAAAVAPGPTAVDQSTGGAGGGLPITGPRVVGLALGGLALLAAGTAAIVLGVRRRRFRP